jgi:hypothetical protein
MRTKVLFLIALLVQTVVYCVVVYQSTQDYMAWTKAEEEWINQVLSENPSPEIRRVFIEYVPYIYSVQGRPVLILGVTLVVSWIILGVGSLLSDEKKTSQI